MKKVLFFSVLLLLLSCKKDLFEESIDGFKEEALPAALVGNWRWIRSIGGFSGGIQQTGTTAKNILTIMSAKTYKWCKNDTCISGKLFLGSRKSSNPNAVDTFLFFEHPRVKTNFPLFLTQFKPIRTADTLIFFDACDDCFSHKFVRQ